MTSHTYSSPNSMAFAFEGRIQIDRSGVGHAWTTVDPDDLRTDVLDALCDEDGTISDGATANVGGMNYRADADVPCAWCDGRGTLDANPDGSGDGEHCSHCDGSGIAGDE